MNFLNIMYSIHSLTSPHQDTFVFLIKSVYLCIHILSMLKINTFYNKEWIKATLKKYSDDTIVLYFEVMQQGFVAIMGISERMTRNPDMAKEIIDIMTY
ncbi:MAG: hypothetical protein JSV32_06895 [Dehalococcoidia bacterium]|nr:MAG: hypothetical protein JSV32_06895 [Dehalococcoidia bacterium]